MAREIKRILISTMPRSGTVFLFNFIAELFGYSKLEPAFTGGFSPTPPDWDPYKFDKTYLSLSAGQVLCAHYPLSYDLQEIVTQPEVLAIYLYRDPRDTAVSAALYIKNVLTHHPLHALFSKLSDAEAIAFMLSGGIVHVENKNAEGCAFIDHEGVKYSCDKALDWVANQHVAKVRYEDLMVDAMSCLESSFQTVGVKVDCEKIQNISSKLQFSSFSSGRKRGDEDKNSHFRKGISGDYVNHFSDLHKAICKQRIGRHLVELGYEKDLCW